jgi:hypothetical protein
MPDPLPTPERACAHENATNLSVCPDCGTNLYPPEPRPVSPSSAVYEVEVCDTCGQHVMESPHATGPCQNGPTHWVKVVPVAPSGPSSVSPEEAETGR